MFSSINATGVVGAASAWVPSFLPVLYIVVGFAVAIYVLNWVARKFGRGGRRRTA